MRMTYFGRAGDLDPARIARCMVGVQQRRLPTNCPGWASKNRGKPKGLGGGSGKHLQELKVGGDQAFVRSHPHDELVCQKKMMYRLNLVSPQKKIVREE